MAKLCKRRRALPLHGPAKRDHRSYPASRRASWPGGEAILTLDDARAEFARFLADDPKARWRIDAALAHVVRWAYMRGRDDAVRDELNELARDAGLKEE